MTTGTSDPDRAANAQPTLQERLGHVTPALVDLTARVLFGEVWERPGLSKRDRSLVTVAALVSLCRTEQMSSHMQRALDNGVSREELVELVTHLAFYAGWPSAMSAANVLKDVVGARE